MTCCNQTSHFFNQMSSHTKNVPKPNLQRSISTSAPSQNVTHHVTHSLPNSQTNLQTNLKFKRR